MVPVFENGGQDSKIFIESFSHAMNLSEESFNDVENLKESLRLGLSDARKKITFLRNEVKEKQRCLEREREMREKAEQELANLSFNGHRDFSSSPTKRIPSYHSPNRNGVSDHVFEELESAKAVNKSLTSKLAQAEKDLENMRLTQEDLKFETEAAVAARGAAIIDKIYSAQKEREAAMLTRLKLLTEEKQELLKRLKFGEKDYGVDSGVETGSLMGEEYQTQADFMSSNQLLNHVTSSNQSRAIELHGDVIVDRLHEAQMSDRKKVDNELKRASVERDNAVEKIANLETELREIHEEREQHRKSEKNRLKVIQNQLKQVIDERDRAHAQIKELGDELEQIKIQQSLKNSLSQEKQLRDQFNTTLDEFEEKLDEKENELLKAKEKQEELLSKLNHTTREKNALAEQVKDLLQQSQEDKEKLERLERLLTVTRNRTSKSISEKLT